MNSEEGAGCAFLVHPREKAHEKKSMWISMENYSHRMRKRSWKYFPIFCLSVQIIVAYRILFVSVISIYMDRSILNWAKNASSNQEFYLKKTTNRLQWVRVLKLRSIYHSIARYIVANNIAKRSLPSSITSYFVLCADSNRFTNISNAIHIKTVFFVSHLNERRYSAQCSFIHNSSTNNNAIVVVVVVVVDENHNTECALYRIKRMPKCQ